jgi:hypothetical protein
MRGLAFFWSSYLTFGKLFANHFLETLKEGGDRI